MTALDTHTNNESPEICLIFALKILSAQQALVCLEYIVGD